MTELSNGFRCMFPDCFNCDHPECDAPSEIDTAYKGGNRLNQKVWHWTDDEINYLIDHPLDSAETIARKLGRTVNSVKNKIKLSKDITEMRSAKRQEWILNYLQENRDSRTAEIARLMNIPKGVISYDCHQLAQKHEEIKRKNGRIKWVECS